MENRTYFILVSIPASQHEHRKSKCKIESHNLISTSKLKGLTIDSNGILPRHVVTYRL